MPPDRRLEVNIQQQQKCLPKSGQVTKFPYIQIQSIAENIKLHHSNPTSKSQTTGNKRTNNRKEKGKGRKRGVTD
jgi:hypothetical protein